MLKNALKKVRKHLKKRSLAFNDFSLSEIGFGASPLGQVYGTLSQKEAQCLVSCAIDQGITYFDVAPYYGNAETVLGKYLPKDKSAISLSTKVGRYGPKTFDFSKKRLQASLENSLKQLKTDYFDIVFCHDIEFAKPKELIDEAIPFLDSCKQKGLIGAIGISGYPLEPLLKLAKHPSVSVVLSYAHYCLINTQLADVIETCQKSKVDIINASPLAMGLLSQKGPSGWHPAKKRHQQIIASAGTQALEKASLSFAFDQDCFASTLVGFSHLTELDFALNCYKTHSKECYNTAFESLSGLRPLTWS